MSQDTQAIHAKLDELLWAKGEADSELAKLDREKPEEIEKRRDKRIGRTRRQRRISSRRNRAATGQPPRRCRSCAGVVTFPATTADPASSEQRCGSLCDRNSRALLVCGVVDDEVVLVIQGGASLRAAGTG
jgi:hypothetical protein